MAKKYHYKDGLPIMSAMDKDFRTDGTRWHPALVAPVVARLSLALEQAEAERDAANRESDELRTRYALLEVAFANLHAQLEPKTVTVGSDSTGQIAPAKGGVGRE